MRNHLALISLLAACRGASPAPPGAGESSLHYELQPIERSDMDDPHWGHHSAAINTLRETATLDVTGNAIKLTVTEVAATSYVHCPKGDRGPLHTMQACIDGDEPAANSTTTVWSGARDRSAIGIRATLTSQSQTLRIDCRPHELGLACTFNGKPGYLLTQPTTVTFGPNRLADGHQLFGQLTLSAGSATLDIASEGTRRQLTAKVAHRHGRMMIEGGGPTGRANFACAVTAPLICDVVLDPEVFGRPATDGVVTLTVR